MTAPEVHAENIVVVAEEAEFSTQSIVDHPQVINEEKEAERVEQDVAEVVVVENDDE